MIRRYLFHLASHGNVTAPTQDQALSALLFLYREVFGVELPYVDGVERAERPARAPAVLTREAVRRMLSLLSGTHRLTASLLYSPGSGLMECAGLRVEGVGFGYGQITVGDGKGEKDRRTILPVPTGDPLKEQSGRVRALHDDGLMRGCGRVYLPHALERKYPKAAAGGDGSGCSSRPGCRSTRGQAR